jgi:hypothetical protein
MGQPRLSPSQRAYLFNRDKFLQGLQERSESLFADGYRVAETNCPHRFVIFAPCKDGEKTYFVDAIAETCTCLFYIRQVQGECIVEDGSILACKHLQGLKELVRQTRLFHFDAGDTGCGYRLWIHWLAMLSERRHRRRSAPIPADAYDPDGTPIRFDGPGQDASERTPANIKKGDRR